MRDNSSLGTSNFLKGVAIVTVLVNHYLNLNVSGDFRGYSNLFIGIFFFQSGYATYYSLQKKFLNTIEFRSILLFWYNRVIRIFPLLWCAWALELWVRKGDLSLWIPTGIHGEGHYWFVPALFQCYLLAPFTFRWFATKIRIVLILCLSGFLVINVLLAMDLLPVYLRWGLDFINARWRGLYFLHFLLFLMGLLTNFWRPKYLHKITRFNKKNALFFFWFVFLTVLSGMVYIRHLSISFPIFYKIFLIGPIFFVAFICIYSFQFKIEDRVFAFIGSISYAIYLFHMSFYQIVGYLGKFSENFLSELGVTLILMPFFLFGCRYIEQFGNYIYVRLKSPVFMNHI